MNNIFTLSCIPSIHGDDFFYTSYSCSLGDIDDDVNCTSNRGLLWRDRDTGNLPSKRKSVSSALSLCTVEHPPRCPVLHASISVKASLFRTSPTTIRFGDSRKVFFSSASISTFIHGGECHRVFCGALQFLGILNRDDTLAKRRDLCQNGIQERRFPTCRTTGRDDISVIVNGSDDGIVLTFRHRALRDVICKGIDTFGVLADVKRVRLRDREVLLESDNSKRDATQECLPVGMDPPLD